MNVECSENLLTGAKSRYVFVLWQYLMINDLDCISRACTRYAREHADWCIMHQPCALNRDATRYIAAYATLRVDCSPLKRI